MKKLLVLLLLLIPVNTKACISGGSVSVWNRTNGHQKECRTLGVAGSASGSCILSTSCSVATISMKNGSLCYYAQGHGLETCSVTLSGSCTCDGKTKTISVYFNLVEWGFANIKIENHQLNTGFKDEVKTYSVSVDEEKITLVVTTNDKRSKVTVTAGNYDVIISDPVTSDNRTYKYTLSNLKVGVNKISIKAKTFTDREDTYVINVTKNKPKLVEKLSLNKTDITLNPDASAIVEAIVEPANADISGLTWKSSNESIVTVNDGIIKAVGSGDAKVTASVNGKKATVNVKVLPSTNRVAFLENIIKININEKKQLYYKIYPENAVNKEVTFSSSNTKVAKVDKNGLITAVGTGRATIGIKSKDGKYGSECLIIVEREITALTVSPQKIVLQPNQSVQLDVGIIPKNATNRTITFKNLDPSVAIIDENGLITAIKEGETMISATHDDIYSNAVEVVVELKKDEQNSNSEINKTESKSSTYILLIISIVAVGALIYIYYRAKRNGKF